MKALSASLKVCGSLWLYIKYSKSLERFLPANMAFRKHVEACSGACNRKALSHVFGNLQNPSLERRKHKGEILSKLSVEKLPAESRRTMKQTVKVIE